MSSNNGEATPARHVVGVSAGVIDQDGRILVVQRRDNGTWEAPGGIVELDESVHAALVREVWEETGLDIEPLRLTGVYKNVALGVVAFFFRARLLGGTERTSDETAAIDWWTTDQVRSRMSPTRSIRILDALRDDDPPAVRLHDGRTLFDEAMPRYGCGGTTRW